MPTRKDALAARYLELQNQRAGGLLTYAPTRAVPGPDGVSAAERNNWNVAAADMADIEAVLADDQPFTDKRVETAESTLDQINDAVQKMQQGDVSRYNHVPQFLREYYGRKALIEVFGSDTEFPPMTEELARKLDRMTVRPEFRDAISRLIERNAVDGNGNSLVQQLREYDTYLNQRMLADTLKPISAEEAGRIRQKYPGEKGEQMIAENADRQRFMAKSLFMAQLGRVDLVEEDGSRSPFLGSTAELFSHGSRVAFTLPAGEKKDQDLVYDAWRKNARDSGVLFKGRFASHEMHRRQVDANGNVVQDFEEKRIRWKKQLKRAQFHKKVTTYVGNYGMNIPLGGMGRTFNQRDCIDTEGAFGHLYVRTRKGDAQHCGAILMGFENAQPKKESCIGQLHNFKAVSHDLSAFYSTKTTFGKLIGGRETDLSHMSPQDLTGALNQFELSYKTLQERAKTDPKAVNQLQQLNHKLCGRRLTALEVADLMTSIGMEKGSAVRCVNAARSPKDANYTANGPAYRGKLYTVRVEEVQDPAPDMPDARKLRPEKPARAPLSQKDTEKYRAYLDKLLGGRRNATKEELARDLSKALAAHLLKEQNRKFNKDTIEEIAKITRRTLALDRQKPADLMKALESENAARLNSVEMRDKLYRVPETSEHTYCRAMNQLLENMVDPKGHSEAYQKLYQSVQKAAQLSQSLPWKDPRQRAQALMEANMRILNAVDDYTADKGSVRKTLKGANTFDSALDAAACVQRYVPGARLRTEAMIDRINLERKPQEKLNANTLTQEYNRGVNRNEIDSWEDLAARKRALSAPKNPNAQEIGR